MKIRNRSLPWHESRLCGPGRTARRLHGTATKGLSFPPSQALPQPDTGTASLSSLALVCPPVEQPPSLLSEFLEASLGQRFLWKALSGPLVFGTPELPCRLLATGEKELTPETCSALSTSSRPGPAQLVTLPTSCSFPLQSALGPEREGQGSQRQISVTPFEARRIFLGPCSVKPVQLSAAGAYVQTPPAL